MQCHQNIVPIMFIKDDMDSARNLKLLLYIFESMSGWKAIFKRVKFCWCNQMMKNCYTWALFRAGLGRDMKKPDSVFCGPGPAQPDCRVAFSYPGPARRAKKSSGHRVGPSLNLFFLPRPGPLLLLGQKILPRPGPTACFGPTGRAIFGLGRAGPVGPGFPCPAIKTASVCWYVQLLDRFLAYQVPRYSTLCKKNFCCWNKVCWRENQERDGGMGG
jgi:hypothetical protein